MFFFQNSLSGDVPGVHINIRNLNKFRLSSVPDFLWLAGLVLLRGRLPRDRKEKLESLKDKEDRNRLYDIPHHITIGGVEDPFLQVSQKNLCMGLKVKPYNLHSL